jgi:trk system potassium uptake protein TrkH
VRLSLVFGVIGHLLRLFSVAFLPPIALALADQELVIAEHFAVALAAAAGVGWYFERWFPTEPVLRRAEALAIVAGTWLVVGLFGAIPYLFSGLSFVDAVFESISGFTTTGATILTDFEAHGRAFFLWRAMTQWFGGLGVIALFVVVLPRLGIAGRQLFFAEASISTSEGISPQVRGAARKLWLLYVGLTALAAGLLMATGYEVYDAVVHALTTLSAGGFSPNPASIQGYQNPAGEWVLIGFMVVSGTSFPLLWRVASGRVLDLLRDSEFLAYAGTMMVASFLLAALLSGGLPDVNDLRVGTFQVTSLASSTGYASADFELWEDAAKAILVAVMIIGGCAGSACGGPKVIRYLILLKFLRREMTQVLHPQAVIPLRYRRSPISSPIIRAVITLVFLYIAGYVFVGVAVVVLEPDADLTSGFAASLACFGNIGPAFGEAGPMGSYALFNTPSKIVLTFAMWLGRLEIVTVLALLHHHVWLGLRWKGPTPRPPR